MAAITEKINKAAQSIPEANVLVMAPSMISGYGMSNGLDLNLQDRTGGSIERFSAGEGCFRKGSGRTTRDRHGIFGFQCRLSQYWVDIDAAKCQRAGVTPSEILETVASYYGGSYISNFNRFSRLYSVTMQASPESRVTSESLNHIFVRLSNGENDACFLFLCDLLPLRDRRV